VKEATDMRTFIAAIMILALSGSAFAQDSGEAKKPFFAFKGGIDMGTDSLPTGVVVDGKAGMESWTRFGFQPDLSFGPFGIGIDLTMRFKFFPDPNDPNKAIDIYKGDWVPDYLGNGKSLLDLYLPKLLYVRYGLKGEDPLFVKLGSIDDLSLGNGFIVSNYSNMQFMPDQRIFGLDAGIDGAMFKFPFVGFEALTGNLAQLDVVGGRVFVRPFVATDIPILKNMQLGATIAMDTKPDLYASIGSLTSKTVSVYGGDVMVPILGGKALSLAAFGDLAFEPNNTMGAMLGFGGRLMSIFTYGAQLRLLQDGFIPSYFDANYDLYRAAKFKYMQLSSSGDINLGWYSSLGTSFFEDKLVFIASLDGPFKAIPAVASANPAQADYPHAKVVLRLDEGLIGSIFFDASYEKYFIGMENSFFSDLIDPTNAAIGLAVNYQTGASLLSLKYDVRYDPRKH
jgi:hypothetical protein